MLTSVLTFVQGKQVYSPKRGADYTVCSVLLRSAVYRPSHSHLLPLLQVKDSQPRRLSSMAVVQQFVRAQTALYEGVPLQGYVEASIPIWSSGYR